MDWMPSVISQIHTYQRILHVFSNLNDSMTYVQRSDEKPRAAYFSNWAEIPKSGFQFAGFWKEIYWNGDIRILVTLCNFR